MTGVYTKCKHFCIVNTMIKNNKKKEEALLVSRFINEVLVGQLSIPHKQIVNDTTFAKYTGSQRPDLLISEEEYESVKDEDGFIKNVVAYAEVKDNCSVGDKEWNEAITAGQKKAKKLSLPYFIVTNCKTSIFFNTETLEEIKMNTNPIRAFQSIDIFRLIKNKLKKEPKLSNIITNVDSASTISEAIFNNKLWELKTIYRDIDFGEGGKSKIDFTIGFVALEYFEEKKQAEGLWREGELYWSNCDDGVDDKLVANLKQYIDNIMRSDASFAEFSGLLSSVKNFLDKIIPKQVREIYNVVESMKPLHNCGFDLFGAVYESFANKKEKEEFGEFFTRRHYTHIFAKLLLENETSFNQDRKFALLDPACGTGGFLTEAFKILRNSYSKSSTLDLNAERFLREDCFYGRDIKEENISRTKLNMFLTGDGHTNIKRAESLGETFDRQFDYILTNPPYGNGSVKADIASANSKRKEIAFLFKIIRLLKIGGRACVILPDGVLENPSYQKIRQEFLERCNIYSIISLPKFAFAPYTKEKTYAVFFQKRSESMTKIQSDDVWMYIIDNDGLANSDKRFLTRLRNNKNGWMHDEISGWVSIGGEEKIGVLETRWKKRYEDSKTNGTEWIDERGLSMKKRKAGHLSILEIQKSRFNLLPELYLRDENTKSLYKYKSSKPFKANKIFGCISGNPGVFEEFIYQHLQIKGNEYKVLSSSLSEDTEMGYMKLTKNEEKDMNTFNDKMGIHVARLGRGGSMLFLNKSKYVTTDKAYILYLEDSFKEQIGIDSDKKEEKFLRWFIKDYQNLLYTFAPKTDNSAWNKTNFMKEAIIEVPSMDEM